VQVDPIKPRLKLPGTKRVETEMMNCFQTLLSKFKLRRYTLAYHAGFDQSHRLHVYRRWSAGQVRVIVATIAFGMVGRCRLTPG
jgi:hypothetical protein